MRSATAIILKPPASQIAEERVFTPSIAEVQIAKAIAVKIPGRNPGAAYHVVMFGYTLLRDEVRPEDAGVRRREERESGFA